MIPLTQAFLNLLKSTAWLQEHKTRYPFGFTNLEECNATLSYALKPVFNVFLEGENAGGSQTTIWDKRDFKNLDDNIELGTRNIKVALKRVRKWARDGAPDELDLNNTIRSTAENGYLDVKMRPERRNAVKVLLFLDVGGSMDPHIRSF